MSTNNDASTIKQWLTHIFTAQNLTEITVNIIGNAENGDGFLGDIVFVKATGKSIQNQTEEFDLVVKCSKNSEAVRDSLPVREAFYNEIFIYEVVLPAFHRFESSKGVKRPLNSAPKFYGKFTNESLEIVVLENMKPAGFELWPKQKALTLEQVKCVLREYGRLHAVSVAMQDQKPEEFCKLSDNVIDTLGEFYIRIKMKEMHEETIAYVGSVLKDSLNSNLLSKWLEGKKQVHQTFTKMRHVKDCLKVITHGDCWSNNFMYKFKDNKLEKAVILDWQLSSFMSPILDVSHFVFSCIANDDVQFMDQVLDVYYQSFATYLVELGSDPKKLYPKEQFLIDWKRFSRYGVIMAAIVIKMVLFEDDQVPDITKPTEGNDFSDDFNKTLRDSSKYRDRIVNIVKYVAENDLFA